MAQQNTTSTLDGLFRIVYGSMETVLPEVSIIQKKVPFKKAEKIGKSYNFPVVLSNEAGVTYLAAGAGVQTLNDSIAAVLKEATIDANQIIIRGQMDYEAAAKAAAGGAAAFKNASELLVENLMETASKRAEMAFLYGQSATGLGTADSSSNVSGTITNVTMLAAGWAPGIWAGAEGAVVQFYKVSDDTLISSSSDSYFTVTSVAYSTRVIKFTGTATGITALDSALGSGDCYIQWKGAKSGTSTWVEPVGIDKIVTNTGSLFGIDAAVYGLWSGSSFDFSGVPTVAKILNMVGQAVSKGGLMEEVDVLLSPKTFMYLSGTMTDYRRLGGESKTGIGGFENITLMGPNGKLNLVPHPMIKEGECFAVPFKRFKRIGSQEFSFETPGRSGEMFLHVPDKNAYELRIYGAQAIICTTPAKCTKGTGITH